VRLAQPGAVQASSTEQARKWTLFQEAADVSHGETRHHQKVTLTSGKLVIKRRLESKVCDFPLYPAHLCEVKEKEEKKATLQV
jgi:hypothetical protein